jgi:hypothetical protein
MVRKIRLLTIEYEYYLCLVLLPPCAFTVICSALQDTLSRAVLNYWIHMLDIKYKKVNFNEPGILS